jgi:hypothetical protein
MNKVLPPLLKLALAEAAAHTAGQGSTPLPNPRRAERTGHDHLAAAGHQGRAALKWAAVGQRGFWGFSARTSR